jgi:hypothetical protein
VCASVSVCAYASVCVYVCVEVDSRVPIYR